MKVKVEKVEKVRVKDEKLQLPSLSQNAKDTAPVKTQACMSIVPVLKSFQAYHVRVNPVKKKINKKNHVKKKTRKNHGIKFLYARGKKNLQKIFSWKIVFLGKSSSWKIVFLGKAFFLEIVCAPE